MCRNKFHQSEDCLQFARGLIKRQGTQVMGEYVMRDQKASDEFSLIRWFMILRTNIEYIKVDKNIDLHHLKIVRSSQHANEQHRNITCAYKRK